MISDNLEKPNHPIHQRPFRPAQGQVFIHQFQEHHGFRFYDYYYNVDSLRELIRVTTIPEKDLTDSSWCMSGP